MLVRGAIRKLTYVIGSIEVSIRFFRPIEFLELTLTDFFGSQNGLKRHEILSTSFEVDSERVLP